MPPHETAMRGSLSRISSGFYVTTFLREPRRRHRLRRRRRRRRRRCKTLGTSARGRAERAILAFRATRTGKLSDSAR